MSSKELYSTIVQAKENYCGISDKSRMWKVTFNWVRLVELNGGIVIYYSKQSRALLQLEAWSTVRLPLRFGLYLWQQWIVPFSFMWKSSRVLRPPLVSPQEQQRSFLLYIYLIWLDFRFLFSIQQTAAGGFCIHGSSIVRLLYIMPVAVRYSIQVGPSGRT